MDTITLQKRFAVIKFEITLFIFKNDTTVSNIWHLLHLTVNKIQIYEICKSFYILLLFTFYTTSQIFQICVVQYTKELIYFQWFFFFNYYLLWAIYVNGLSSRLQQIFNFFVLLSCGWKIKDQIVQICSFIFEPLDLFFAVCLNNQTDDRRCGEDDAPFRTYKIEEAGEFPSCSLRLINRGEFLRFTIKPSLQFDAEWVINVKELMHQSRA